MQGIASAALQQPLMHTLWGGLMARKWTLTGKHLMGLALYSAIFPASILAMPFTGSLGFWVGSLISLPFVPIAGIVFWISIKTGGNLAAFFFTWLSVFFMGWLVMVPYVASRSKGNS
jgi:hypothetical protein